MSKRPPRSIPSDDYTVEQDGELYHPHEGEYVNIIGSPSLREYDAWSEYRRLSVEIDAIEGEPDERRRMADLLETSFEHLCDLLATRIVGWTWTDDRGRPLPAPCVEDPDDPTQLAEARHRLKALAGNELYYLLRVAKGESGSERKNGLSDSPISSSATPPPKTRMSRAMVPSPTKD